MVVVDMPPRATKKTKITASDGRAPTGGHAGKAIDYGTDDDDAGEDSEDEDEGSDDDEITVRAMRAHDCARRNGMRKRCPCADSEKVKINTETDDASALSASRFHE